VRLRRASGGASSAAIVSFEGGIASTSTGEAAVKDADLYRKMAALSDAGDSFVLVTIVDAQGSTPRKTGAKMLVLSDATTFGTVGGGKIEHRATRDAMEALRAGTSRLVPYELRSEGEYALDMACGGEASVFLEVHIPLRTLVIVGAGHIAQKLCPMARLLDFRVVVVDDRPEFAVAERLPDAEVVILGDPAETASIVAIDRWTAVVIVTRGHLHDEAALASTLGTDAFFIGMIGSRSKVRTVFAQLEAKGVPRDALARVRSPVGLDLGGETPGEISLSIMAQIVALCHGRGGYHLPGVLEAGVGAR
jgi:xanthine dehydrogenase accessory factor